MTRGSASFRLAVIAVVALFATSFVMLATAVRDGPDMPVAAQSVTQPRCSDVTSSEAGVAMIETGSVRGVADGATYAYKGIPYAAPPVGELRWRPPVPAECWEGLRDGSAFGPVCLQYDEEAVVGSEDCLTLNVWAPAALPAAGTARPVMVFIHGGGNAQGSSSQAIYDGRAMAERGDVVLISINYRLGQLGFLAHPALAAEDVRGVSGNYGNLDQIAALQWVRRNVAAFNGDPNRVTIFGESAGGVNVCILVASPLARGLFTGAIIQSGGCAQPGRVLAEQMGERFVAASGCQDAAGLTACLRGLSGPAVRAILPTGVSVVSASENAYPPHVDGYVLLKSPLEAIRAGEHNRVPLIIGANADETLPFVPLAVSTEAAYRQAVSGMVGPAGAAAILGQYPASAFPSPRQAFAAVTTDARFVCPTRRYLQAAVAGQSEPVYRYFFTHALESGQARAQGAFHGLELVFVFRTLGASGGYRPTDAEVALAESVQNYWTRFAATGDPNGAGAVEWPRYDPAADTYLRLDTPITAEAGVRTERCDFWDRLIGAAGTP
jgi:para-nitrobenzyl esterase